MTQPLEQSSLELSAAARKSLVAFLRRNRQRAMIEWEHAVRAIPAAALLDRDELRDHVPALIDRVLELIEVPEASATIDRVSARHAIERMREGFQLEQVAWTRRRSGFSGSATRPESGTAGGCSV